MDKAAEKDGNITKEKIDRALAEAASQIADDLPDIFCETVEIMSKQLNIPEGNSVLRETAAMCVVQGNLLWALEHVLYGLFNIESTEDEPGSGTEGSRRE